MVGKNSDPRKKKLTLQELANTAWAFAMAGQKMTSLFAALATVAQRCSGDFNPQDLTTTAWALATVGHKD